MMKQRKRFYAVCQENQMRKNENGERDRTKRGKDQRKNITEIIWC